MMSDGRLRNETGSTIRSNLDAVLKQGMLRIFQHGLARFGTPLFRQRKLAVLNNFIIDISSKIILKSRKI